MHRSLSFAMQRVCSQPKRSFLRTKRAPNSRSTTSARTLLAAEAERERIGSSRVAQQQQCRAVGSPAPRAKRSRAGTRPQSARYRLSVRVRRGALCASKLRRSPAHGRNNSASV